MGFRNWLKKAIRPVLRILGVQLPVVGIAVIIHDEEDDKILLGMRLGDRPGAGCFQCSGGGLELYETMESCAAREVFEETNLEVKNLSIVRVTNNISKSMKWHYITIWFMANPVNKKNLMNVEPEKNHKWEWFDLSKLPFPLFEGSGVLEEHFLREQIRLRKMEFKDC